MADKVSVSGLGVSLNAPGRVLNMQVAAEPYGSGPGAEEPAWAGSGHLPGAFRKRSPLCRLRYKGPSCEACEGKKVQ